ncbi:MAG: hypothetical protein ACSHW2_03390 [Parasphingopyxis sp.]
MTLFRLALIPWAAFAASATAQPAGDAGAALPPPAELAFAVPEQFHGRWFPVETACSTSSADVPTIISAEGLRREEHWAEPVQLIELSEDGRRLTMQADLYFEAPPILHRSVWHLGVDGNSLVITDSRLSRSGEEVVGTEDGAIHRVELVRCESGTDTDE